MSSYRGKEINKEKENYRGIEKGRRGGYRKNEKNHYSKKNFWNKSGELEQTGNVCDMWFCEGGFLEQKVKN